jgi:hypothetical protein
VILRLVEVDGAVRTAKPKRPADVAVRARERQLLSKRSARAKPKR